MLKAKGRKWYTFVVGKINPPKLANFLEIDCFVYIACPETTSTIDSKEYLRPIVTPFELEVALTNKEWNGDYIVDFAEMTRRLDDVDLSQESDEPHFSLVTGSLIAKESWQVAQSPAAAFLNQREYKGLDLSQPVPVELASKGQMGIAKGYKEYSG